MGAPASEVDDEDGSQVRSLHQFTDPIVREPLQLSMTLAELDAVLARYPLGGAMLSKR